MFPTAKFARALPKPELHAHLNGSIPPQTIAFLRSITGGEEGGGGTGTGTAGESGAADRYVPEFPTFSEGAVPQDRERITTSLSDAFARFREVHELACSLARVRLVARDCVLAFARDGCCYLELRTTPRKLVRRARGDDFGGLSDGGVGVVDAGHGNEPAGDGLCSKLEYLEAVLEGIREAVVGLQRDGDDQSNAGPDDAETSVRSFYEQDFAMSALPAKLGGCGIVVRVIVSCNRALGENEAVENVEAALRARELAAERALFRDGGVRFPLPPGDGVDSLAISPMICGVELSGDPTKADARTFLRGPLQRARDLGFCVAVHASEVDGTADETEAVLRWKPERLGHMIFVRGTPNDALMRELALPVELCLTSNIVTDSSPSYHDHHGCDLIRDGHPVALCTDDPGIFDTSLSSEYCLAAEHLQLSPNTLWRLARQAMQFSFCGNEMRQQILAAMELRFATGCPSVASFCVSDSVGYTRIDDKNVATATADADGDFPADPWDVFEDWYQSAQLSRRKNPWVHNFVLATVGQNERGELQPEARTVSMHEHSAEHGLVFCTNSEGPKADQLAVVQNATAVFQWAEVGRQVRIVGRVRKAHREHSERLFGQLRAVERSYFRAGSQGREHPYSQSRVISDTSERAKYLRQAMQDAGNSQGDDVTLPPAWSAFCLTDLDRMEFIDTSVSLSVRVLYERREPSQVWKRKFLMG